MVCQLGMGDGGLQEAHFALCRQGLPRVLALGVPALSVWGIGQRFKFRQKEAPWSN